jgi:hypothetical protein
MSHTISAKYLLTTDTLPTRDVNTVIPSHVTITRLPARVAMGARKPKIAGRGKGERVTLTQAARATNVVCAKSYHAGIRGLAARGW